MFKRVVQQQEYVERAISAMRPSAAFAFALACTERQWPVLLRASEGKPWAQSVLSGLRHGVDVAWKHVLHGTSVPLNLSTRCRGDVSQADDYLDAVSRTIANSIVDLLEAIEKGKVADTHRPSYRNFDLLELLLDEHGLLLDDLKEESSDATNVIASVRDLIEREIQQQNWDLQILSKGPSSSEIEEVRRASREKSLFGKVWFSQ